MKLSFLILAHKNPSQLQRLVDYLLGQDCKIFLHLDKKSGAIFDQFSHQNQGRKNLFIYAKFKIHWGGFTQIQATIFLLKEALNHSPFDFVSLISGQDLPIKPLAAFKKYLSENRDRSFLMHHALPSENWADNGGLDRYELFWITNYHKSLKRVFGKLNALLHLVQNKAGIRKRSPVPLHGGANWFTINFEAANYVMNFQNSNSSFLKEYKHTRLADEIILQTILVNSELKDKIINDCQRFIDWHSGPEFPRIFRMEDRQRLIESEYFLARKFDEIIDNEIISAVYSRI